ncbi:hypothetical protein O1L55_12450 [Streptomyces albulus]|nr:hypothetical protein [Streptomyces noursei]
MATAAHEGHDPVADLHPRRPRAELLDLAGDLQSGDVGGPARGAG